MKFIYTIFLFLAITSLSFSQEKEESFNVNVDNQNIKIENKNIWVNCGSIFKIEIIIENKVIKIIEIDTSTIKMWCMCYFDLEAEINNLESGVYTVEIYRQLLKEYLYPEDTLIFLYSQNIEINTPMTMPPSNFNFKQSDCLNSVDVIELNNNSDIDIIPNPFIDKLFISNNLNDDFYCTYSIFLLDGSKVLEGNFLSSSVNNIEINTGKLLSGTYIFILKINGNSGYNIKRYLLIKN